MIGKVLPAAILFAAVAAWSQNPAGPSFEVASVKASNIPMDKMRMTIARQNDPGRIHYTLMTLRDLIRMAYDVKDYQISGPEWLNSERFDVTATFPADTPKDQVPLMMQNLLAERFQMAVHREKRELPAYAMVVAKNGPKFKESAEAPEDKATGPDAGGGRGGGMVTFSVAGAGSMDKVVSEASKMMGGRGGMINLPGGLVAKKTTMTALADMLSRRMDRPVLDETGLTAKYDFNLQYTPEPGERPMMFGGPAAAALSGGSSDVHMPDPSGPPLPVALQQQLGLKLEPKKLPLDMVIVDKAEKIPTEN